MTPKIEIWIKKKEYALIHEVEKRSILWALFDLILTVVGYNL